MRSRLDLGLISESLGLKFKQKKFTNLYKQKFTLLHQKFAKTLWEPENLTLSVCIF